MDQMLTDDSVAAIASAVTPWKRACAGQRSLKICESFQSAARGAATVITLARVSRPRPSSWPPRAVTGRVICTSDRQDGLTPTLLPAQHGCRSARSLGLGPRGPPVDRLDRVISQDLERGDLRGSGRANGTTPDRTESAGRRALDTNDDAELRSSRPPVCSQGCESICQSAHKHACSQRPLFGIM